MTDFEQLAAALKLAMYNSEHKEAQLIRLALADCCEEGGDLKQADLWRNIHRYWQEWLPARSLTADLEREANDAIIHYYKSLINEHS